MSGCHDGLLGHPQMHDAGVVDQHVDACRSCKHFRDAALDGILRPDIQLHHLDAGLVGSPLAAGAEDAKPFAGKHLGGRLPDTRRGAGDEHNPPLHRRRSDRVQSRGTNRTKGRRRPTVLKSASEPSTAYPMIRHSRLAALGWRCA
jgi:hypothetical protein